MMELSEGFTEMNYQHGMIYALCSLLFAQSSVSQQSGFVWLILLIKNLFFRVNDMNSWQETRSQSSLHPCGESLGWNMIKRTPPCYMVFTIGDTKRGVPNQMQLMVAYGITYFVLNKDEEALGSAKRQNGD